MISERFYYVFFISFSVFAAGSFLHHIHYIFVYFVPEIVFGFHHILNELSEHCICDKMLTNPHNFGEHNKVLRKCLVLICSLCIIVWPPSLRIMS